MLDLSAERILNWVGTVYHLAGEVDLRQRIIDLELRVASAQPVCSPERRLSIFLVRHGYVMRSGRHRKLLLTLGNRLIHAKWHK